MTRKSTAQRVPVLVVPAGTHRHEGARALLSWGRFLCGFCNQVLSVVEVSAHQVDAALFPLWHFGDVGPLSHQRVSRQNTEARPLIARLLKLKPGTRYEAASLFRKPVVATAGPEATAQFEQDAAPFRALMAGTDEFKTLTVLGAQPGQWQQALNLGTALLKPRWAWDPRVPVDPLAVSAWEHIADTPGYTGEVRSAAHAKLLEAVYAHRRRLLETAAAMVLDPATLENGLGVLRGPHFNLDPEVLNTVDLEPMRAAMLDAAERWMTVLEKAPTLPEGAAARRDLVAIMPEALQKLGTTDIARVMKLAKRFEAVPVADGHWRVEDFLQALLTRARAPEGVRAAISWLEAHPKSKDRGTVMWALAGSVHPEALTWLLSNAGGRDRAAIAEHLTAFRVDGGTGPVKGTDLVKLEKLAQTPGFSALATKLNDPTTMMSGLEGPYWSHTGQFVRFEELRARGPEFAKRLPSATGTAAVSRKATSAHNALHRAALELVASRSPDQLGAMFAGALSEASDAPRHLSAVLSWCTLSLLDASGKDCGCEQTPKTPLCAIESRWERTPVEQLLKLRPIQVDGAATKKFVEKKGVLWVPLEFAFADLEAWTAPRLGKSDAQRLRAVLGMLQKDFGLALKPVLDGNLEKLSEHLSGDAPLKKRIGAGLLQHLTSKDVLHLLRALCFVHLNFDFADDDYGLAAHWPLYPGQFTARIPAERKGVARAVASFLSRPVLPAPALFKSEGEGEELDAIIRDLE